MSWFQIRTGFDEELDRMKDTLNDLPEILRGVGQVMTADECGRISVEGHSIDSKTRLCACVLAQKGDKSRERMTIATCTLEG